jgi:hypothetical protein
MTNRIAPATLTDYAVIINDEYDAANDDSGDYLTPPAWTDEDIRHAYAEGYEKAVADMQMLFGRGYSRGNEVANILNRHAQGLLSEWVRLFDEWIREWPVQESLTYEPRCEIPESWSTVRQRIIARDGGRCVVCESTHRLEVDHIVEVRYGGCPDDDNLRTLCAKCHAERRRG